jgi:RNA polymerase sigma-70 factor (ECF subfamily)
MPQLHSSSRSASAELSDGELVKHAQADPGAFAALYSRYLDSVYHYCYRRLGGREAAEDATSQIFIQALAALPKFSDRGSLFRAWLFRIAHNVVVDQYRLGRPASTLEFGEELTDRGPTVEDLAVHADQSHRLRRAIEQLPDRQRQVVELRLAGLTGPEIGDVLGCKARTVDVAQFRAVARLRVLLGPDGELAGASHV